MRIASLSAAAVAVLALVAVTGCSADRGSQAGPPPTGRPTSPNVDPSPLSVATDPAEFNEADLIEIYRLVVPQFLTTPADLGWDDFYPRRTVAWDRLVVRPVLGDNDPPLPGFEAYGGGDLDMWPAIRSGIDAALSPIAPTTFGTDLGVAGNDPENCRDECGYVTVSHISFDGRFAKVVVRVDSRQGTSAAEYTLEPVGGMTWRIIDRSEPFRDG